MLGLLKNGRYVSSAREAGIYLSQHLIHKPHRSAVGHLETLLLPTGFLAELASQRFSFCLASRLGVVSLSRSNQTHGKANQGGGKLF